MVGARSMRAPCSWPGTVPGQPNAEAFMAEANKQSRVDFVRIEVGVIPNARRELKNIRELAADIKERGLLVPLLVWHKRLKREPYELPDGRSVWDRYILLGGHRRHAAITLVRSDDPDAFEVVPVVLFTGNEDDATFAGIADNLSREDLTVVDLAHAVHALKLRGHTQAVIAKRLSKSQAYISRLLKLRESLAPAVLDAVASGEMPVDTALALCDLDERAQLKALERFWKKLAAGDKRGASQEAKADAGRPTRVPIKSLRSHREFLAERRQAARSQAQAATLSFAEQLLAWAMGEGPWPTDLPKPPGDDE